MCELFAMSSRVPAVASFSLSEFSRHGGHTDNHRDGWGVAFYEGLDAKLMREADSASNSACMAFLRQHQSRSQTVIGHIRQATQGAVSLANTQPLARELGGRVHVFAHNGDLSGIDHHRRYPLGHYRPVGETDSELAFCHLLGQMEALWSADVVPELHLRLALVQAFAESIRPLGPANFIYSDAQYLFVHSHLRSQPGRRGYHPPGLHWLQRSCRLPAVAQMTGVQIEQRADQQIQLFASVPLSDEAWVPLPEGEIMVVQQGEIIHLAE